MPHYTNLSLQAGLPEREVTLACGCRVRLRESGDWLTFDFQSAVTLCREGRALAARALPETSYLTSVSWRRRLLRHFQQQTAAEVTSNDAELAAAAAA